MYKKLCDTKGKKNKDQIYLIKEMLDKLKEAIKNVSEDKKFIIKENKMIINIVECTLYFNQLEQQSLGLKILTPNQMLSKLSITLAQLKAGNNYKKLQKEIRQLFFFLHRSKKLTKTIYNNLIKTI